MGKRTSDFMALTVILTGAGLGLGLTTLFARAAPVAQVDDASVEIQIVPGRVMVRNRSVAPTIYFRSRAGAYRSNWAPSERLRIEVKKRRRTEEVSGREELERLMTQVQELLHEAREGREFKAMFVSDGLEALEILEDLDGDLTMTLDILQSATDGDEQRRRRRRRHPRRAAEVPDPDAPGN